ATNCSWSAKYSGQGSLGLLGTTSPLVYLVNYLLSIQALMDASSYGAGSPLTVIFVIPFTVIIVVGSLPSVVIPFPGWEWGRLVLPELRGWSDIASSVWACSHSWTAGYGRKEEGLDISCLEDRTMILVR